MKNHLKRQSVPKNWPISRKGTKYVARPNSDAEGGIPLVIIVRDMLNVAKNTKEVKRAIHMKNILVNNKRINDEKMALSLFDTITIIPLKKNYRLSLSDKGKFALDEIKENEANSKISKILNKKMLKGKKTQLNLMDGRNFLSEAKCEVNDSVVINFKEKKIEKCIPLQEKMRALVFAGKHTGKKGTLKKIDKEKQMVELESGKENLHVLIKQIIAAE